VLLNKGDGTFGAPASFGVGATPYSVTAADLDGDGKLDLAVSNFDSNAGHSVSVLRNLGGGAFAPAVNYTVGTGPIAIAAADFNGDGKLDLATSNKGSSDVSVIIHQGNGTFGAAAGYPSGTTLSSLLAADLNGDGKPDLAATSNTGSVSVLLSGTLTILLNQGNGTFVTTLSYDVPRQPNSIAPADFNGDGTPDFAVVDFAGTGSVSVLLSGCFP